MCSYVSMCLCVELSSRNMHTSKRFLFTVILAVGFTSFKTSDDLSVVKTDAGVVSGTLKEDIHIFKGIPFAAPPIGDLRWKAPQPVQHWSGVKVCDKFSASPMQASPAPFSMWTEEFLIPKEPITEDCLYLNVWSGAKSSKEKRAVLVWIYGGGFQSGGSACPIYDGEAMAKRGIVFVSINYRVGVFGFFAHPELTKESGNNASGNYGIMEIDARYVLQTDDGALITIVNRGLRHADKEVMQQMASGIEVSPSLYYFRSVPQFETGNEKYGWLNTSVFVASGIRKPAEVIISVFKIL